MNMIDMLLSVSEPVHKRLHELRAEIEAESIAVVFTRAFALYDTVFTTVMFGNCELFIRHPDGREERVNVE